MQSSRDECDTDSESDDSFDDGYDENLMADQEDKNRIMKLTEREREMELYERFQRRERLKTRFEIKRKLKIRKKRGILEKEQTVEADVVVERKATHDCAHQADSITSGKAYFLEENDSKTSTDDFSQCLTGFKTEGRLGYREQNGKGLKTVNSNRESKPSNKGHATDYQLDGPSSINSLGDEECVIISEGKTYLERPAKERKKSNYKSRDVCNNESTIHIKLYEPPYINPDDDCVITFEGKLHQRHAEKRKQSTDSNKQSENPRNKRPSKDPEPDESQFVDRPEDECVIIFDSKTRVNNPPNIERSQFLTIVTSEENLKSVTDDKIYKITIN